LRLTPRYSEFRRAGSATGNRPRISMLLFRRQFKETKVRIEAGASHFASPGPSNGADFHLIHKTAWPYAGRALTVTVVQVVVFLYP
jgi:hypothetical protein